MNPISPARPLSYTCCSELLTERLEESITKIFKCKQMCFECTLLFSGIFVSFLRIQANVEVLSAYSRQRQLPLFHSPFPKSILSSLYSKHFRVFPDFTVDLPESFRTCTVRLCQCSVIWRAGASWTGQA